MSSAMKSGRLHGRTVLVIGGSSGIGYEVARQATEEGARLIIAGRNPAKLVEAAECLNGAIQTVAMDAHDGAELEAAFSDLEALDHVVSMVGDSMSGGFLTTEPETMRHVLHSKFWSNWLIGRNAADKVRDGGSMTFTSGTGARAHEASATYVANLGVSALVQGLAYELAPRIRVNAVAPTFMGTATSFWKDLPESELEQTQAGFAELVPLERLGTPEQVASTYIHLITNDFITGQVMSVDGGVMLSK
jgi:NAD(P)-dependent dehydrogenase (short-subunit alcohol dehydrogenase family)